ncbi:lactate racemase domain-containing protein [Halorussus gelatinilyticus]|uniref:Lactate racemase domain-containing protein n=1 Tax=Halorussus gelatinilyticus TaxID=2937524 RepID=A0A8U0IHZ6_9EURY|nr:lactate racemase domain-containing protein [Halorussus gelatinilyticus]UPW00707.1 lactate racemase domain-containing protein [Halorussus gelatinilyticus]
MRVPYGDTAIDVSLPDCDVTVAEPPDGNPVDPREDAARAMADPHGPPLRERVDADDEVAIVVTDVTRATPDDVLVDLLVSALREAGVERDRISVVVGLGLHRPMTDEELRTALGEYADLAQNHDAEAARVVGEVEGPDGDVVPVELNPTVAAADAVVSTGMVEPHQYAGFSGGAKTVAIGAGGESLIRYTHGPEMLAREGVRLGRVDGNPFRATLDEAGDVIGVDFCLNVTHGPAGILGASAGDHREVVRDLAELCKDNISVSLSDTYDAVVAGVGAPKDANLYQATRAATYLALGDYDPLRSGGRIVVPARLQEGAGEGTGERRFYDWLSGAESADALYDEMRRGYDPGAQRAFVVARVLREYDCYVTDSESPAVVEECLMHARESVADAVEPGSDVLVVPDALDTLLERA